MTGRGTEIARLIPVQRSLPTAGGYADLVVRGLIVPAKLKAPADDLRELPRLSDPDGLLVTALLEEREERA